MSNVATTSAGLPAELTSMATGLAASINQAGEGSTGNDLYAKMGKDGIFVYGADNTEFEEDSRWALNPLGIYHGFVAWGDKSHGTEGQNLGEVLVPASQPMPVESDLPEVKGSWSKAVALQMRCVNGEDEGVQVLWKSNSYGGRKAYAALLGSVVTRINAGEAAIVPILECASDSYQHASYGKIYTPEFNIQEWVTMDAQPEAEKVEAKEPEPEPEPEPEAPKRRRRRAAA